MAFQLNPQLIQDALTKATQELPPLPTVIVKVMQITEDADAGTINELERLIRTDQAVSSKLLRVVNSAYFGLSGQVSSLAQAVVILGYTQVRNLVLSISMMSQFQAIGTKAKDHQQHLWELAFGAASGAQLIAKHKRIEAKDQELAFVGGLMQNVGSLFMLSTLQRSYLSVLEESENTKAWLSDVETLRLGTTHAAVGQQLLLKWKLPENLALIVGRHEGPFGGEPVPALYAVHAGKRLAFAATHPGCEVEGYGIDPAVREWLGFSDEEYDWLIKAVKEKVDHAVQLIGGFE